MYGGGGVYVCGSLVSVEESGTPKGKRIKRKEEGGVYVCASLVSVGDGDGEGL